MTDRIDQNGLSIDGQLHAFLETEALPGSGIAPADFWAGLRSLVDTFGPQIKAALAKRADLQAQMDQWARDHKGKDYSLDDYQAMLKKIGYLVEEGPAFSVGTQNVDPEIASIAGPQLVVPVMNARFALNAANARWGSLYDAFYGTDVIAEDKGLEKGSSYNVIRGDAVVDKAIAFLDEAVPLKGASHKDVTSYQIDDGHLVAALNAGHCF